MTNQPDTLDALFQRAVDVAREKWGDQYGFTLEFFKHSDGRWMVWGKTGDEYFGAYSRHDVNSPSAALRSLIEKMENM